MPHALILAALAAILLGAAPLVTAEVQTTTIQAAYLELRSGPGRGYPRLNAVGQGEEIELLKRRTDWVRIRTARGFVGWVGRDELLEALHKPTQEPVRWLSLKALGDRDRGFEAGVDMGDFDGASLVSAWAGYALNPALVVQAEAGRFMGAASDGLLGTVNLVHRPFPDWRVAPFVMVGTGILQTDPKATVAQSEKRDEELLQAGLGADIWIARRMVLRLEYRNLQISTQRDEREEVNQWKAGLSIQF